MSYDNSILFNIKEKFSNHNISFYFGSRSKVYKLKKRTTSLLANLSPLCNFFSYKPGVDSGGLKK
jgi:hypothetical protein